jgi:hypothetical protein
VEAFRRHPTPGPQSKLSAEQRDELAYLLNQGAEVFGFRGEVWTWHSSSRGNQAPIWGELSSGALLRKDANSL